MYRDLVSAYKLASEEIKADRLIPSGEVFFSLLEKGIGGMYRDEHHAGRGEGRYALGLIWYATLTGRSVLHNSFSDFDTPISSETAQVIRETVEAVRLRYGYDTPLC